MQANRYKHSVVSLEDGKVMILGSTNEPPLAQSAHSARRRRSKTTLRYNPRYIPARLIENRSLLYHVLPRPFQPIVESCALHPQPTSRSRMASQSCPLRLINRQRYPANVFHKRFALM
jgi:hypothetical protein